MDIKDSTFYETEIHTIREELDKLPMGFLTKHVNTYYVVIGATRKGITKNKQKIMQLARKAYLSQRLRNLEWNFALVKKQTGRFKTEDPAEIIRGLASVYQTLPAYYFFHTSANDIYKGISTGNNESKDEALNPEGLFYYTESGLRVRSKSERTIAEALDKNEIPYEYEAALALNGTRKYPDFSIRQPYNGKLILWEHFGLMDNNDYRMNSADKIALYVKCGFYPNDNLICTYEHDMQNPVHIHTIIKTLILR